MAEVEDEPGHPEPRLSAPVPLTSEHDLSGFDCGEPALNDWLPDWNRMSLVPADVTTRLKEPALSCVKVVVVPRVTEVMVGETSEMSPVVAR